MVDSKVMLVYIYTGRNGVERDSTEIYVLHGSTGIYTHKDTLNDRDKDTHTYKYTHPKYHTPTGIDPDTGT